MAVLTFYPRAILLDQFARDQHQLRHHQINHFFTLIAERYQQMSRLGNLIPRLAFEHPQDSVSESLQHFLETDGATLDLEWDIRSVHWIPLDGKPRTLWPPQIHAMPEPLVKEVRKNPEQLGEWLLCNPQICRQYVSSPVLWNGATAGTLILSRALASILIAFQQLTGADMAIATSHPQTPEGGELHFIGATHPQRILLLLQSQAPADLLASHSAAPLAVEFDSDWYEIFRIDPRGLGAGAIGFIINRTTEARQTIGHMARNSLIIGLIGLLVAEALLLLIMNGPVRRTRTLSKLLPLLADQRFATLAQRLPRTNSRFGWRDEIDLNIQVIETLNQRMARLHQEREAAQNELRWLADHDSLTALLNRRRFNHQLAQAIEQASRDGTQGALLFIDLDNFKDVNDTSGHQAGDRLLKRIGKKIAAAVGPHGQVGRFGGDEFAVLLIGIERDDPIALCECLLSQISTTQLRAGAHRHQVSASIGIALFPDHGQDTQALMANADLAMYQAKSLQRGRWHLYSDADKARAQANARVLWNREIVEALHEGRLQLYYQPILALPERRVWRAEALLRMHLADGRLANPAEFIPVAERTGLINAIDRWVIAEAIRLLAAQPHLALAVNLSAKALADASLDAELMRLLENAAVDPQRLTLEITETVAIDNMYGAVARMNSIRALGCRFALDDFGSGFASYAYLKQLPVTDVKIDGSFIRDLDGNAEDRIFVKSVADMAHAMGKKVIAEFVESEAILQVLEELRIDFAQGYHIGRPIPEPPPDSNQVAPRPIPMTQAV